MEIRDGYRSEEDIAADEYVAALDPVIRDAARAAFLVGWEEGHSAGYADGYGAGYEFATD